MTNNSLIYLRVWMDKFGLDPDYWLENSPHLPISLSVFHENETALP
ncbi:hypothetical protein [Dapis sp. BLCC M126]